MTTFTIQVVNIKNQPKREGGDSLVVTLGKVAKDSLSGVTVLPVIDMKDGTYRVSFSVPSEGYFLMKILLSGVDISGSPFSISATIPKRRAVTQPEALRCFVCRNPITREYLSLEERIFHPNCFTC